MLGRIEKETWGDVIQVFIASLLGFVAGAVAGYVVLMVGYSVYTGLFKIHDHDGGGAMAMGLVFGPIVGLICGIVAAVFCGSRAARSSGVGEREP
ncbi:hypothetical protein [Piscinibacter sp.]|uniref:hypothetical protein n=1 Tax=Piscinibacter sp. TaxID=1903157 RepID=UPI0039E4F95B